MILYGDDKQSPIFRIGWDRQEWKSFCQKWSCDQPQTTSSEAEEKEAGKRLAFEGCQVSWRFFFFPPAARVVGRFGGNTSDGMTFHNASWLPSTVSKWRSPKSNFSFFRNEFIFYRWRQNECRFFAYSMCPWRDFGNALVEKIPEKTKIETKSGMKICHSIY